MRDILVAATIALVACGGTTSSDLAQVDGSIAGQALTAQDAVSSVMTIGHDSQVLILVTNAPHICATYGANEQPANSQRVMIAVGSQTGYSTAAPTGPGVFAVHTALSAYGVTGNVAVAMYWRKDAHCIPVTTVEARSGTVTLTRADASGYSGTFDITFSDQSHVTGRFDADQCAAFTLDDSLVCI